MPKPDEATRLLHRMVADFRGGVAYLDADLVFRFCNDVQASYFGRTSATVVGLGIHEVAPDSREFWSPLEHVAQSGEGYSKTASSVTWPDRTEEGEHHFTVTYMADVDQSGLVVGVSMTSLEVTREVDSAFAVMAQDLKDRTDDLERVVEELRNEVAKRRETEKELQAALNDLESKVEERTSELQASNDDLRRGDERFKSIVELSADAIVIADASGQITLVNGAASKMFGYEAAELIGSSIEGLLPSALRHTQVAHRQAFHADPHPRSMGAGRQLSGLAKDGREFPAEASLTPFQTRDGLMVAAAITDVTEKRRLEAAVEQTLTELRRSNAELEQFAYVASHDLQEPLRMVSSHTQLLARRYEGALDEDANTYISFAVEGASRMQQLINDLLAFSRVGSAGKDLIPVDTEKVLTSALFNLTASIQESGAEIERGPMPRVAGDAMQLTQVLQNLIANALKFHGDTPPRIKVSAELHDSTWTFSIEDNGIGIDPRYKDRVFVIFQRLHTRKDYPGTGIGLAVCKRIIERHGGTIWFETNAGNGATFHFTLRDAEMARHSQPTAHQAA